MPTSTSTVEAAISHPISFEKTAPINSSPEKIISAELEVKLEMLADKVSKILPNLPHINLIPLKNKTIGFWLVINQS